MRQRNISQITIFFLIILLDDKKKDIYDSIDENE